MKGLGAMPCPLNISEKAEHCQDDRGISIMSSGAALKDGVAEGLRFLVMYGPACFGCNRRSYIIQYAQTQCDIIQFHLSYVY